MIRTRFAPSPTGFLHIGSLRTALFSYALAKKEKGMFILRIEDTDKKREVAGSVENIIKILKVFGMNFDEGPGIGGPHKPYIQSQRLKIYKQKVEELVTKGMAYYCFCTSERLEDMRKKQQKERKPPMYDGKCRELDIKKARERIETGEKYVIRLKVPKEKKLSLEDAILGKIEWNTNDVDDQVLLKSDGYPTYHLSVVVDDIAMGITHITRGMEWLSSVPKHLLLFEAFDSKVPIMAHMPLILDPKGGKLSKRKGAVSTEEFLQKGYFPEALLNFLMLLGWAPNNDQEFFTLEQFVEAFSMETINKASPVFDRQKLLWFNGEYIRKLPLKELTRIFKQWLEEYYEGDLKKAMLEDKDLENKIALIQERISLLSEIPTSLKFFHDTPKIPNPSEIKGVKKYDNNDYKNSMHDYKKIIENYKNKSFEREIWEKDIRALADKYSWKHGDMFMLIRIVICGSPISPPLFESMAILGRNEVTDRLKTFVG